MRPGPHLLQSFRSNDVRPNGRTLLWELKQPAKIWHDCGRGIAPPFPSACYPRSIEPNWGRWYSGLVNEQSCCSVEPGSVNYGVESIMLKYTTTLIVGLMLFGGMSVQAQAQSYGAIAYSPSTGAHGYSFRYRSQAGAQQRALRECNARSRGCRVAIWYRNACGAVAVAPNGSWGSGWGNSKQRANFEALKVCGRYSRGCSVRVNACSH